MKALDVKIVMTPAELVRRHEARNKRVLYKQGAYVRTAMQRSMRYATKKQQASKPGEPPRAHKDRPRGPLLRKLVKFRVDLSEQSTVVGPELVGGGGSTPLPRVLDKGGKAFRKLLKPHAFSPGEYGPIRQRADRSFARIQLRTGGQAARATQLVIDENELRQSAAPYIKPRPFTAPRLTDGGENLRKLIAREPL